MIDMMTKKQICIGVIAMMYSLVGSGQKEAYYIDLLAVKMNAQKEVPVQNGRIDLLTDSVAYEVEWAYNWKHSIGQAMWYALQKNKKPGIILLMRDINDYKYFVMLNSALSTFGLSQTFDVKLYPEDFSTGAEARSSANRNLTSHHRFSDLSYSCNRSSGVRHNSNCSYYNCKNCVPCDANGGKKPCNRCGG